MAQLKHRSSQLLKGICSNHLMLKVLSIFGTRPEAIKMSPLIQRLAVHETEFTSRVCITAQHRQLLDQVLELFRIVPDYDLDVMEENQSPTGVSAAILSKLEPVLKKEKPDWVLVQGDTTSAAAAALAAFYAGAKVGHVEAGLRTGDKWQPFPEEINRRITTLIADLHFAPTEQSRRNLLKEGVPDRRILVTGNPVVDALRWALQREPPPGIIALLQKLGLGDSAPEAAPNRSQAAHAESKLAGQGSKFILVTAHRRENFGLPLENICDALRTIAGNYQGQVQIIFLVHPNPNVSDLVNRILGDVQGVTLIQPLDYVSMAHLLSKAHLIVTDSGGLQEEATSLGKPILVTRRVTDRPESVDAGTARVVGVEREGIIKHIVSLLDDAGAYRAMARAECVYGEGQASEKIIEALSNFRP
jgi:UDP-N-acetylglucosamine 2-epimerase (non-hydrolysing)